MNVKAGPPRLFQLPLAGRIAGLDIVRGLAIVAMTAYHQSLVVRPEGAGRLLADFFGFLAAPLFLVVSGVSAALHERRHRSPLAMAVRGGLLFLMAWSIDLALSRSPAVDWDIFQIIGASYVLLGLAGGLGGVRKAAVAAAAIAVLAWRPELRPDRGFFAPWPFALYFFGGYLLALFGLSPALRPPWSRLIGLGSLLFLALDFSWNPPPDRTRPEGFVYLLAMACALLVGALEAERRGLLVARGRGALARWGTFPLTLYFIQQAATVARLRLPLALPPTPAWAIQTAALLAALFGAALVLERRAFLDVGWWLRRAERLVLRPHPAGVREGPKGGPFNP